MNLRNVLVFAIIIFTARTLSAEDYEIRLTRPWKVGDKYEMIVSASGFRLATTTTEGQYPKKGMGTVKATMEGIMTVREVDEHQRKKKISLIVTKCQIAPNGDVNETEPLQKGTQIVARVENGKVLFSVDGNPPTRETVHLLNAFIDLPTAKETDDEMLGTKERKKVGDRWDINAAQALRPFSNKDITVSPAKSNGSAKLEKIAVVDGIACLQLNIKMESNDVGISFADGTVATGSISVTFSGAFPVDASLPCMSEETRLAEAVTTTDKPVADAPGAVTVTTSDIVKRVTYKPLRKERK